MRRYRVSLDPAAIADFDGICVFVPEAASKTISDKLIDRVLFCIDGLDTARKLFARSRP